MNNLLRTLTESKAKSVQQLTDLRLLLGAVKESRRQSHDVSKLADAFYDSLEGLLLDLRTVTMDNRDAEAFLKPVSKTDYPDYYDLIANPMDLQTMLKKVKQKQYKSKKEFKDDLDLIWSNCFFFNATENHPLRLCATRLKVKAERLLENITDWKERADPTIPADISTLGAPAKINGVTTNGNGRFHSPAVAKSPSPGKAVPVVAGNKKALRDSSFSDFPAIVRTADGMASFMQLDHELDTEAEGSKSHLAERLRGYIAVSDDEDGEVSLKTIDGEIGVKRKLNGFVDNRPRKRVRMHPSVDKDVVELWWDAVQSDELLGNGLPTIAYRSSEAVPGASPPTVITDPPRKTQRSRKKKKKTEPSNTALLYHMNNNIRTLRRVRTTHAKFAALNQSTEEGGGPIAPSDLLLEDVDDVIDERPWKPMISGIEIGEKNADDCLHWMGSKVLEHAGFQGTSKAALDVLSSVTSEYLLNVGRTIRFMCDKYAKKMTPEEIVLHTLFESGTTRIYELERYIKDDVIRYGGRLAELEKKLATAYREATTEEAWDDEALFQIADDEEEDGQFVMGNFADSFGEDFLGLRELGIAAEFGLSSLTIPKKLLKGKGKQGLAEPSAAKPSEPPPPFPPPPPFIPLDSKMVENQIGLLKPYYQQRLSTLATAPPTFSSAEATQGLHPSGAKPEPATTPQQPPPSTIADPSAPPIVLPDDAPSPSHTKIGPIGQIMKGAPSASNSKKKSKGKAPVAPSTMLNGPSEGDPGQDSAAPSPMTATESQKRGRPPTGSLGKKKGPKGSESLPAVVMASA